MNKNTLAAERVAAGDLRSDLDLTGAELRALLQLAAEVKARPQDYTQALRGKYASLLFEKPSLRTRLTFELALKQLGGDAVVSIGLIGDREPVQDMARNLDRWTQCIVARVFSQQTIDDLAKWSGVPVVNALSDLYHPCQALADVQTVAERFGTCLDFPSVRSKQPRASGRPSTRWSNWQRVGSRKYWPPKSSNG